MQKRIEWIDISKGISIILVVLGHLGFSNIPYVGEWLSSFRMPFFFFVSGIVFFIRYDFKTFIKKRSRTLIMPYFYFSFIVGTCLYFSDVLSLQRIKHILLNGWGGIALWFIPVLFFTQLVWFLIRKNAKAKTCFWIIIFLAILGSISSLYIGSSPYNFLLIFTSVFYFGMGSLMKCFLAALYEQVASQKLFLYMIIFFLLSLGYMFNWGKTIAYASNQLGYGLPSIVSGLGGSLFICTFVNIIRRIVKVSSQFRCILLFAGKNSYIILAFHQLFLIYCSLYIRPVFSNYLIYKSIEAILVTCSCYLSIMMINRYMPWMIGRTSSQNI